MEQFFSGLKAYRDALKAISKYDMWGYLFIPALFSFIFFLILGGISWMVLTDITAWIMTKMPDWEWLQNNSWIFTLLLGIGVFFAGLFTVRYIVIIALSPVFSFLSEKTEEKMFGGQPAKFNLKEFVTDIIRAIRINGRNLIREILLTIALWILSFVPLVGFLVPFLMFTVQSYYGGYGLLDFTLERKRMTVKDSINFVHGHRGLTLGLGAGFMIIAFIPVIGWALGPTLGVIASTIRTIETLKAEQPELLRAHGGY